MANVFSRHRTAEGGGGGVSSVLFPKKGVMFTLPVNKSPVGQKGKGGGGERVFLLHPLPPKKEAPLQKCRRYKHSFPSRLLAEVRGDIKRRGKKRGFSLRPFPGRRSGYSANIYIGARDDWGPGGEEGKKGERRIHQRSS